MHHYPLIRLPHNQTHQLLLMQGPCYYLYSCLRLELRSKLGYVIHLFPHERSLAGYNPDQTNPLLLLHVVTTLTVVFAWLPTCASFPNLWRFFPHTIGATWSRLTIHTTIPTRCTSSSSSSQQQNIICSLHRTSSPSSSTSIVLHIFSKLSCSLLRALSSSNLHWIPSSSSHHNI